MQPTVSSLSLGFTALRLFPGGFDGEPFVFAIADEEDLNTFALVKIFGRPASVFFEEEDLIVVPPFGKESPGCVVDEAVLEQRLGAVVEPNPERVI